MEAETSRSRAGAAVQLMAALAALASPPLLLAAAIGNPLPSWPIEGTRVVDAAQAGLVPSSVWVNVLAVTAWATWAVLVAMLVIEVVAIVRDRPSPRAVPGWIRHVAQVLVAAAITLAGPGQQALALGGLAAPAVVATAPVVHTAGESAALPQPVMEGRIVTVAEGDSWGGFAADVLGDSSLGPELRAANVGRNVGGGDTVSESTAFVEPGWRLLIPNRLDPGPRQSAPNTKDVDVAVRDDTETPTWEVERGD
ncbi:MAG TPA: hypothetical protein VM344_00625, partial [Vitreimonas sp.]|nr:hypothetical protein [Vitreimonas sp.]